MMKRKIFTLFGVLLASAFFVFGQQSPPATHLKAGDPAPDFTLRDQNGQPVTLSSFKGKKNVILAFYVLAFTGG